MSQGTEAVVEREQVISRSCEWCNVPTTVMGPRFGTLCEGCFSIEQGIGSGIESWRKARADRITLRLTNILVEYTVYEYQEVRDSLDSLSNTWSDKAFAMLMRLHEAEIDTP